MSTEEQIIGLWKKKKFLLLLLKVMLMDMVICCLRMPEEEELQGWRLFMGWDSFSCGYKKGCFMNLVCAPSSSSLAFQQY